MGLSARSRRSVMSSDDISDAVAQSKRKWDEIYGDGDYDDLWQISKDIGQVTIDIDGTPTAGGRNTNDIQNGLETESNSSATEKRDRIGRRVCCGCFACCWLWVLIGGIFIWQDVGGVRGEEGEDQTFSQIWIFTSGAILTFSVLCGLATWDEQQKKKKRREPVRETSENANGKTKKSNANGNYW